ncbi:MAG: hypothetical protein J5737_06405 [Bacteroidales bacterium]|nr:hypothetical protein [Bacteroidales bacterium]
MNHKLYVKPASKDFGLVCQKPVLVQASNEGYDVNHSNPFGAGSSSSNDYEEN